MIGACIMDTNKSLTPVSHSADVVEVGELVTSLAEVGHIANQYASQNVFSDYHSRIAHNTLRRQHDDLALFGTYLAAAGVVIAADDLLHIPHVWNGITYGLVDGFVRYQVQQGYAIGSIN